MYLTFLDDFANLSTGQKSVPLNIVIKLASAEGRPAVKLSDDMGKITGNAEVVRRVKQELGYAEHSWKGGNEKSRWGTGGKTLA